MCWSPTMTHFRLITCPWMSDVDLQRDACPKHFFAHLQRTSCGAGTCTMTDVKEDSKCMMVETMHLMHFCAIYYIEKNASPYTWIITVHMRHSCLNLCGSSAACGRHGLVGVRPLTLSLLTSVITRGAVERWPQAAKSAHRTRRCSTCRKSHRLSDDSAVSVKGRQRSSSCV
jgi:hypothetical protein